MTPVPGAAGGIGPATGAAGGGIGAIFKAIAVVLLGAGGVIVGAGVVGVVLIFTGDPQPCAGRVSTPTTAASNELRTRWKEFGAKAATGPASIGITELQATSRGVEYVKEKDAPVTDLQVYFCPDGHAEAAGKVSFLGRDIKIVVSGTLDLSGAKPEIQIDSVRAGNLPGGIGTRAVDLVLNTGDLKTLNLDEHLTSITYTDGVANVQGGPR